MPVSEAGKTPPNYNVESGQAKFTKDNENVDVHATTKLIGLTKEQLEQYRNDPFWKPVRYALIALFWLVWLAMFTGAILIVVLSPKCAAKVEPKHYENAVNYQMFTPTFRDSDGDGVGDLKGIQEKLNDLRKIGVTAIWPTPIVQANKDEYSPTEVMDVMEVDPRYGTKQDLEALISATHSAGLHFIMDLPLTVGVNNPWAKSIPGATITENKNSKAGLLNLDKAEVQEKLVNAATQYLQLGVDGIHLADYGLSKKVPQGSVKSVQPLVRKIRAVVASDPKISQKDVLIFTDPAWSSSSRADMNSTENYRVLDLAEGTGNLIERLHRNIETGVKLIKDNSSVLPIWKFSDIDSPRIDQQLDANQKDHKTEIASLLTLLQLFLPGPVNVYYGQEIAMPSNSPSQIAPQQGTMRWEQSAKNVGFTSYEGNKNFFTTVENATDAVFDTQYKDAYSPLKAFKRLAELRSRDVVFQRGDISFEKNGLSLYSRYMPNTTENVYILAVNWATDNDTAPKKLQISREMVQNHSLTNVEVKVPSAGNKAYHQNQDFNLEKDDLLVEPYQAVVVRLA